MIGKVLLASFMVYFLVIWPVGYVYTELIYPLKKKKLENHKKIKRK